MLNFKLAEKLHKSLELVSTGYEETKRRMMNEQRALTEVLEYIGDSHMTSILSAAINELAHGDLEEDPQKALVYRNLEHRDDEIHRWLCELAPNGSLGAILSRYGAATSECISAAAALVTRYITDSFKAIEEALSAQEDNASAA